MPELEIVAEATWQHPQEKPDVMPPQFFYEKPARNAPAAQPQTDEKMTYFIIYNPHPPDKGTPRDAARHALPIGTHG